MRSLCLLQLLVPLVLGFSDTSPFLLISSSAIPQSARKHHILSTEAFATLATAQIRQCASEAFILVSQPSLHVEDLTTRARPVQAGVHLKELLASVPTEHQWLAENVYVREGNGAGSGGRGEAIVDMGMVVERLQEAAVRDCGAVLKGVDAKTGSLETSIDEDKKPKVLRVDFDALPADPARRQKVVEMHDAFLHSVLEMVGGGAAALRYTLVLTSSPIGVKAEEDRGRKPALELRSVPVAAAVVMKRDSAAKNWTTGEGGLFHRYQFFTPAIFMGYIAFVVMIAILYIGLTMIGGIEVSYAAFEKEAGPAAQKKQQ